MGLRNRSIRLRVGILIAVPVLCLLLLYAFTASITFSNALGQARAKSLKTELATPISDFQQQAGLERGLALLSLAAPTDPRIAGELGIQEGATTKALSRLEAAIRSPAVTGNATGSELTAMRALLDEAAALNLTRSAVADNAITKQTALADYDSIIDAGNNLLQAIIDSQVNVTIVTQSLNILNLDRADQAALTETDVLASDIAQGQFPAVDRIAIGSLASTRQQLVNDSLPATTAPYHAAITRYVTVPVTNAMLTAESTVTDTPWRIGAPPARVLDARSAFIAYSVAMGKGLAAAGTKLEQAIQQQANKAQLDLALAAGLGLLALIASIGLSVVLGRGLVRQLRELRESALALANDKLPQVISQLRAGETIDLDEYKPTDAPTSSEIEQVREAFTVVQHVAVQSAVDEARLRRGISDVFRNLAGRSQSLLHRQLSLLDGMERRATEPDQLEDLFRIDHLTTRMRRHAEGLIILSGDTPARGWRQPVPLIDVLRAAVAEVEDYTRIRVLCRTGASVAGHAVADVIHLLAELAENATVFSPPNTPVRMQGDSVGRGFAIEIEDRGLGISAARLEEINANLATPPQFDLSGSDRLGLFIAGQLAQRHGIKVTLRPSVYGGTTAIVLIPTALVVEEHALPAGQDDRLRPERIGGRHAALTAIPAGNGHPAGAGNGYPSPAGYPGPASYPSPSGDPERSLSGGGFSFGRLTPQDVRPEEDRSGPAEPLRLATPVGDGDGEEGTPTTTELAELGLPVRVRQASLAPQLRDAPPAEPGLARGFSLPGRRPSAAEPPAAAPAESPSPDAGIAPASPEAARDMVSAFQRGWQLGRAEVQFESIEAVSDADSAEPDGAEPDDAE